MLNSVYYLKKEKKISKIVNIKIKKNINTKIKKDDFGFIMLRHVRCKKSNKLWIHSINCISKFYPEIKIIIIDDNSNYKFVTKKNSIIHLL